MKLSTTYQSLADFRTQQVKGNFELYIYSFITNIETLEGNIRQAKIGMTTSPYEMRCYKRPVSDSVAFLAIRVHSADFAKMVNNNDKLGFTRLAKTFENNCHTAMIENGYVKDSENFRKESFTMLEIKTILETTLKGATL